MKIAMAFIIGLVLGGVLMMHLQGSAQGNSAVHPGITDLHNSVRSTVSAESKMSETQRLMNSDIALCDQPYFAEVYALSVEFFAQDVDEVSGEQLAEVMFDHARHSGYFSSAEAEAWIDHIKDIPQQFVDIYREDPSVLDSCYDWQVAAVGPPQ